MERHGLFAAAAYGQYEEALRMLDTPDARGRYPTPADTDEYGHTACFYAQMMQHDDIVGLLVSRGWAAMPAQNFFIGPGGRRCYWSECATGHRNNPVSITPIRTSAWTSASERASQKKAKVQARRNQRAYYFGREVITPRKHPIYSRAAVGARKPGKPMLNIREEDRLQRDCASAARGDPLYALYEDEESEEELEGEHKGAAGPGICESASELAAPMTADEEELQLALALSLSEQHDCSSATGPVDSSKATASRGGWVVLSELPGGVRLEDLSSTRSRDLSSKRDEDSMTDEFSIVSDVSERWERVSRYEAVATGERPHEQHRTWASLVAGVAG